MFKKLFIFSLILFFIIMIGVVSFANYALAGEITGTCICPRGEGDRAGTEEMIRAASGRFSDLLTQCRTNCGNDDATIGDPTCSVGETLEEGSCEPIPPVGAGVGGPGSVAPAGDEAPAGGAGEKKDGKPQSIKAITLPNPLGTTDVRVVIGNVIRAVLGVIGSIALVLFMYGGFLWMTAAGDPNKAKKGQQTIIQATIGLIIIFISYTLVNFVLSSLTSIGETTEEQQEE